MSISFKGDTIRFEEKEITFDYDIDKIKEIGNTIVVLLDIPPKVKFYRNLLAFERNGKLLWQVQDIKEKYPDLEGIIPFTDIFYNDDILSAVDFFGRNFKINLTNGNIIDFHAVK